MQSVVERREQSWRDSPSIWWRGIKGLRKPHYCWRVYQVLRCWMSRVVHFRMKLMKLTIWRGTGNTQNLDDDWTPLTHRGWESCAVNLPFPSRVSQFLIQLDGIGLSRWFGLIWIEDGLTLWYWMEIRCIWIIPCCSWTDWTTALKMWMKMWFDRITYLLIWIGVVCNLDRFKRTCHEHFGGNKTLELYCGMDSKTDVP